jgi:hypothetical protein
MANKQIRQKIKAKKNGNKDSINNSSTWYLRLFPLLLDLSAWITVKQ